jgi:hypothetical protein
MAFRSYKIRTEIVINKGERANSKLAACSSSKQKVVIPVLVVAVYLLNIAERNR